MSSAAIITLIHLKGTTAGTVFVRYNWLVSAIGTESLGRQERAMGKWSTIARSIGMVLCLGVAISMARPQMSLPRNAPQVAYRTLPASYVELYREILARDSAAKSLPHNRCLILSAIAVRLWLVTPTPALRAQAVNFLDQALRPLYQGMQAPPATEMQPGQAAKASAVTDISRLDIRTFGELVWLMQQHGLLTPELTQMVDAIVRKHLATPAFQHYLAYQNVPYDPSGNNISHMMLYGYAGLYKYLESEKAPEADTLRKILNTHCDALFKIGDLDEDANNYDSLGFALFTDIVRLLGRENELKASPGFRRLFERVRETVSPTGLVPEYGDSYFSYDGCPLDRVYLLEYAARLYQEPSFHAAARKLYLRPSRGLPSYDSYYRALPLITMEPDPSPMTLPTITPSTVTYRRNYQRTTDDIDKLILRTGYEPGAAMIMLDIYAHGSHSHPQKGPSIAYYEAGGVPLFHNFARHGMRSSITGNVLFATPPGDSFPGTWKANEWFTMNIPVAMLLDAPSKPAGDITGKPADEDAETAAAETDRAHQQHYLANALNLRDFPEYNKACEYLYFDNLRLSGPGGDLLVDGFEWPIPPKGQRGGWVELGDHAGERRTDLVSRSHARAVLPTVELE
ncbi:MAG TPA: hypothetical protein VHV83_13450 [Armatimonadota bacterium]|nr:hypothetical protein [Armatimonadota bacterium]